MAISSHSWAETIVVGICGGTGSGKTTLECKIQRMLGEDISVIQQGSYGDNDVGVDLIISQLRNKLSKK